jgi:hypothetical protein
LAIQAKVERLFSGGRIPHTGRQVQERGRVYIDWDRLYLAYDWAKEWQILLAGLLVLVAAVIFAWASLRAAKIGAARSDAKAKAQLDLRSAPAPAGSSLPAAASPELLLSLEQLRSLIRSALGSLLQSSEKPGEKESSPAFFLCQRILHLKLDQMPPPAQAGAAAQEGFSALLKQLGALRAGLKKDASPAELSQILVQINASARSLVTALAPAAERRRQATQDKR